MSSSLSNNDLVIILMAVPLLIIAVCVFCLIQRVYLAVVVGSPSLSTKFASLVSFSFERLTAQANPDRYLGIACTVRYVEILN